MSQGNDFANYSASVDERSNASEDVWFVAVASDDIKQMTIDQLDEAFRLGVISAQTAVWTEGMEAWAPLGEVADLDADGAEEEAEPASPQLTQPSFGASEAPATSAPLYNPFNPPAPAQQSPLYSANPFAQSSIAPGPSSFAPVTSSLAPSVLTPPGGQAALLSSPGPVALNLDENKKPMGRTRRFRPERWLLAAAGIAAVGFAAYNNSDLLSAPSASAVAASTPADGKAEGTAFAARPYEVGGGAEASKKEAPEVEAAVAKPASGDEDAPIGTAAPSKEDRVAADDSAEEEAEPAAPSKESLKGSFSKAFNKKPAPASKPARAVKARKATAKASKAKASKKPGVPRAASAFDPLNDSLP